MKELPKNFDLSLSLRKYERVPGKYDNENQRLLSIDSFKFTLSLDDLKKPVIYSLDKEVTIDGQKVLFKELISYPVRSEIILEFPEENDPELNLSLSLVEDGEKTSLGSYAYIQKHHDGVRREIIHIRSDYFNPPESRSISIDRYTLNPKDADVIYRVDLENKTMDPQIQGIEFEDFSREDGQLIFTFKTSEHYPFSPFSFILGDGQFLEIIKEATRSDHTYLYYIEDVDYETLEFIKMRGPEYTLEEPILIPIPVNN